MNKKTVLRFIAVMIIGLLLVPSKVSGAAAKSGKWGSNLKWSFSGGVLTISGKGDMDAKAFVGASKSSDPRNLAITKVVIKEGVTSVCDNAFSYQKKLKKVTLPSSIKAVGREAFNGCRKLTTVNFPKNIETIGGFAFAETALKKVKLPEKLKTLKYNAFSDCTGLKTVTFNKKLEKIESAAFMNTAIKAVRLPASLTEIAASALSGCPALGTIKVDPGNKSYLVNNGILFSKDKTRLILYPAKKKGNTYTVPKNIAVIENCAFIDAVSIRSFEVEKGNKNYTSENGVIFSPDMKKLVKYPAAAGTAEYTVPESVTEIGTNALYNSMAEKVTLPSGLITVGTGAFKNSKKL
ncbi:MAG: leucine-rich repeat protein, partial [Lachnospiraceae bacterium]|nr:leucine-rich repeat protein [Lachnospiraceae bacterium]